MVFRIFVGGLCSNFVECESIFQWTSANILAQCETNFDDSVDSGNFSVTGYLPLIQKDFITHMHGLTVNVKEGLPFAWDISLENSMDSYLCFNCLYFTQCLTSFSSVDHFLCLVAQFFILFHPTLMKFSRSTHLLRYFSLETLTSIIKTG